jgi:hypothetical protein
MRGIRLRYWLPLANLAIDAALLGTVAFHVRDVHRPRSSVEMSIRPVAYLQEGQSAVGWYPLYEPPPPQALAIVFGTLPAGLVSELAVPNGVSCNGIGARWVCIHEGLAVLAWFAIGWLAESPPRRKWVLGFLLLRIASVVSWLTRLCVLLMFLAWLAGALWLAVWGIRSAFRFFRAKWSREPGI